MPAFGVSVVVKLCDDHKFVIRACNDPLDCMWLPRCWGTQLKSGDGEGEKPHRPGANRLVACTKISQVILPATETIMNRKSEWSHVPGDVDFGQKRCPQGLVVPGPHKLLQFQAAAQACRALLQFGKKFTGRGCQSANQQLCNPLAKSRNSKEWNSDHAV